ncbi:hypothetical protein AYO22_06785 [Fonsecaea multimorphosa]|nr:hypothetical protein AYO22_06785 [Fonsecaea multimorphosa]
MVKIDMFGRGLPLRMAIMAACQIAFILFGYDQGVFSGIVGNENFLDTMGNPSAIILGIIVSIYTLGAFTGTIVSFWTSEPLGPRKSLWLSQVIIIAGATMQACAYSRAQMLVARFFTGIGTGIETCTVPVYQSELCEAKKRGKYVCSEPCYVALVCSPRGPGIVIAYWFDFGISYVHGSVSWRIPIACQIFFALLVIVIVFGGRNEEALQVLCDVYDQGPNDEKVARESQDILEVIELETLHGQYKWSQILRRDEVQTGRRILLAYGMQFMNQMGGINLVVYYVTSVFQYNVGLDRELSLLLGGVIQIAFLLGSLYPTFYSDRFGRRQPMIWGSFGLFICMMMIAILLSFQGTSHEKPTSEAAVAFFFLFMVIDGASLNCVPWVYGPEILPLHVRVRGQAIGISANWFWNFIVVMITPTLISNLAWKGYLIFMCLNFAFVPLVYFCYPETANLTLEEIDFLFTDRTRQSLREEHSSDVGQGDGQPHPCEVHEVAAKLGP